MPGLACRLGLPALLCALVGAPPANAATVAGGGSKTTDCVVVFDVAGANSPKPPKAPKAVDCVDGDLACDADGERNGRCSFDVAVCVNATSLPSCSPDLASEIVIEHAEDNGDPRFDPDFQAIQNRADTLGLPATQADDCATNSTVTVALKGPNRKQKMKKARKQLRAFAIGDTASRFGVRDRDKVKFTCRPEGDGVYAPRDLFGGTFERIEAQVFEPSCALSGCHDDQSGAGGMNLQSGGAFTEIVGVTPTNGAAAGAGQLRVTPSDADASYLYRKITADLEAGWGAPMPLTGPNVSSDLAGILLLWIEAGAPETGWVDGTD